MGRKILLLHGNTGSQKDWTPLVKTLNLEKFQILTCDLRGHGKSFLGKEKFSLDLFTDDIKNLLNELSFHPEIYLGFSDGANIILSLIKNSYINTEKIILVSPNFSPKGIKIFWFKLFTFIYKLTGVIKGSDLFFKFHNRMRIMIKEYDFKKEDFYHSKNHLLLIAAERDMIEAKELFRIKNSFINSSMVIIRSSNHFSLIKKEEFFRVVIKFIGG